METSETKGARVPVFVTRAHRAILKFVSKDETRPILTAVRVTPDALEATDSYVAARLVFGKDRIDALSFPTSPRTPAIGIPEEGVSVDAAALRDAIARINVRSMLPSLSSVAVSVSPDTNEVTLTTNDLEQEVGATSRTVNGDFPPVQSLFMTSEPAAIAYMDPRILKRVVDAYVEFGVPALEIRFHAPLRPLEFSAEGSDGRALHALAMPLRRD